MSAKKNPKKHVKPEFKIEFGVEPEGTGHQKRAREYDSTLDKLIEQLKQRPNQWACLAIGLYGTLMGMKKRAEERLSDVTFSVQKQRDGEEDDRCRLFARFNVDT